MKFFLLCFFLFCCQGAKATASVEGFHLFVGAGNNFVFPSTFRIGYQAWEYGQLSSNFWGAAKKFPVQKIYYTQMGIGMLSVGETTLGLSAALGCDFDLFVGLGFRVEIIGEVGANSFAGAQGNIGLSYDF